MSPSASAESSPPRDLEERIRSRITVEDRGYETPCWTWGGWTTKQGYAQLRVLGQRHRVRAVHLMTYEALVGPIPAGLDLDHLCRNRNCVRPEHLDPATRRENLLRGETSAARNAAVTACPKGHPYDEANTRRRGPEGRWRECRACHREREAARRARTAA